MTDLTPDVTVIIPTHNGIPYIERAVASIAAQTLGLERMQVVIVDDLSTDATPEFLDRAAASHPSFQIVHRPENFGRPAGPRNEALGLARGRYVFFLDQDDYLCDEALETMVRTADANGTDVVLGRIKGVGGRNTPRSMFTRTVPRTDVFSSNAYRSLNPLKLFRTDMIRRLGLRFDENVEWGEDQPFTALAYLKGAGISILADKDYLYWVYRQDGSNITTTVAGLADRLPVVRQMFDMVADNVPAGPGRDRLMARHFAVELADSAFTGYRAETDRAVRDAGFAEFRRVVAAYYTERIDATAPPEVRIPIRLIAEDRQEDFGAFLGAMAQSASPEALVEGERVFLRMPYFRDGVSGLPDDLYEIGARLKAICQVQPLIAQDDELKVDAVCRLGALSDRIDSIRLVVRPRGERAAERVVPLDFAIVRDEPRTYARIDAKVPAAALLRGLGAGTHDLFLRLSAGGVSRDSALVECAPAPAEPRRVRAGRGVTAALVTSGRGSLSLRVGGTLAAGVHDVALRVGRRLARALHTR